MSYLPCSLKKLIFWFHETSYSLTYAKTSFFSYELPIISNIINKLPKNQTFDFEQSIRVFKEHLLREYYLFALNDKHFNKETFR